MKKTVFLIISPILLFFAMNSCKSDDPAMNKSMQSPQQSAEVQKQSIVQNGIDFGNKMNGMKDTRAMLALKQVSIIASNPPAFIIPFHELQINLLNKNVRSLEIFNQQMRAAIAGGGNIWGVWTWNPNINNFDFNPVTTKTATIFFPADITSTSNNALLTITYVESNVVIPTTNPVLYMPESLNVVLMVDAVQVMKYVFSGSYYADGTPSKLTETLDFSNYNWSAMLTNDTKNVTVIHTFKQGTLTLFKIELNVSGNFTISQIISSGGPQYLINSGTLNFQLMNIAFKGGINDFKGFAAEMSALQNTHDRIYADKKVAIINNYFKLYGYFVDTNIKFADVEFYVVESTNSTWDATTQSYVQSTHYDILPRFVLSDGTKVDAQTYIQGGFVDLIKMLESYQGGF